MLAVIVFLPAQPPLVHESSHIQRWLRLDWIGTLLSLGLVVMLLLALQWGGNTKSWSDPAVIVCLVLVSDSTCMIHWDYNGVLVCSSAGSIFALGAQAWFDSYPALEDATPKKYVGCFHRISGSICHAPMLVTNFYRHLFNSRL